MDSLSEGWLYLRKWVGGTRTCINSIQPGEVGLENVDQRLAQNSSRTGFLATELRESDDKVTTVKLDE